MLNRRHFLGAAMSSLIAAPSLAENQWPTRPVTIIVPYGPGSTPDTFTRIIAERLRIKFGQPFLVDNRSGAGGNIGANIVSHAKPDGYTIGTVPVGVMAFNKVLYRDLPYDAERDLQPITFIYEVPNVFVVPAATPVKTLPEFVEWARTKPNGLSCSSPGVGNSAHLFCMLFAKASRLQALHVPFRDTASGSLPALMRGDVDFAVEILTGLLPLIKEGTVKALAVTGDQRWPGLPDVPTLKELGFKGFDPPPVWVAFAAPKDTPVEIVEKLSAAQREFAAEPAMQSRFKEAGAVIQGNSPEEMRRRIVADQPAWVELIKLSGAQL